jgi:hypothetical protein
MLILVRARVYVIHLQPTAIFFVLSNQRESFPPARNRISEGKNPTENNSQMYSRVLAISKCDSLGCPLREFNPFMTLKNRNKEETHDKITPSIQKKSGTPCYLTGK